MMKNLPAVVIGIDGDIDKNGVAMLTTKDKHLQCEQMTNAVLMDFITKLHRMFGSIVVVIEASWLIKTNWHTTRWDRPALAAAKGYDVGRNHQRAIDIAEWCEHNHIPYYLQKPLKKCWQSATGKITKEELQYIVGQYGNRLPTPCSQDMRDAVLLAWNYAGYPIRVRVKNR